MKGTWMGGAPEWEGPWVLEFSLTFWSEACSGKGTIVRSQQAVRPLNDFEARLWDRKEG